MRKFVAWRNIRRYLALLDKETEPTRRHTLETLLAEERSACAAMGYLEEPQSRPLATSKPKT